MKKEKEMPFSSAVKLQLRAMKDIHGLDAKLFPSIALERIVSAAAPFVLICLSARLLNELAGSRRADVLWMWTALSVAAGGLLSLLTAVFARWRNVHEDFCHINYQTMFMKKQFEMDYADMDKQSTHDLRAQIRQNENWMGWGFGHVAMLFSGIVESITGIISAAALTAGLFFAKVPKDSRYLPLNHPAFIVLLSLGMVFLSVFSGRLHSHADSMQTSLVQTARFGNRVYQYFGLFGADRRDADIRIYNQHSIAVHYFVATQNQSFGTKGPFAKLAKGQGGICHGLASGLSAVFTGMIYVFTCLKALAGAFGVGSAAQYIGAATAFSENLTRLFSTLGEIRNNGKFLKLCYEFLDIPNSMYQGSLTTEKRNDREYQVEFKDVSFRYPGTELWALRHISVSFRVGSRVAVVGENGSGKTTFIKLLCRLYDPQEGEILLNGIGIRKYEPRDYMDIFSVVFQDFRLLSQPLGDNVAGSAEYDKTLVWKALDDAGFGERLTSMPDGLDTLLYRQYGEHGVDISGGEAQKIAIARALYRNTPFLILDEPTAALDPVAEAEIYAQLNQIVDDRTAIYISHRLSSCRFCDKILVFDHGQIVQHGSHDELVQKKDGKYYALWHAQAQYYVTVPK